MFKELKRMVYQVADVSEAKRWYAKVLGSEPLFESPLACVFAVGSGSLTLVCTPTAHVGLETTNTAYWEVADVDQAYSRLVELGAVGKVPPSDVLNVRTAQIVDPFGTLLGLTGPITNNTQHTVEQQPSRTAYHACMCRALASCDERHEIRRSDPFAEMFLETETRAALADAAKRAAIIDTRVSRPLYGLFIARSAFGDEAFLWALEAGIQQIVILGAGYDTRAIRFKAALGTARVFELDAAPTQRRKLQILEANKVALPQQVCHIAVNFKTDKLEDILISNGFRPNLATLFIWEGVTYYLAREEVDAALNSIRRLSTPGSAIVLDYMTHKLESVSSGEPFLFWIEPSQVSGWLLQHGFRLSEDLDSEAMAKRFLTPSDSVPPEKALSAIHLVLARFDAASIR